jgi:hypothetical protein
MMPSSFKVARVFVKGAAVPDLVIAELKRGTRLRQQRAEALLPFFKRHCADGFAIKVEEIEPEENQGPVMACVGRGLDQAERGRAVGPDPAQLPVEIRPSCTERRHGRCHGRVFMGPVQPCAGQQPDSTPVEPGVHPVPVVFDFVQPFRPIRRLIDEFGELRFDPIRQHRRFGAPPSVERSCHVLGHDHPHPQDRFRSDLPVDLPHDLCPSVHDRQHRVRLLRGERRHDA